MKEIITINTQDWARGTSRKKGCGILSHLVFHLHGLPLGTINEFHRSTIAPNNPKALLELKKYGSEYLPIETELVRELNRINYDPFINDFTREIQINHRLRKHGIQVRFVRPQFQSHEEED